MPVEKHTARLRREYAEIGATFGGTLRDDYRRAQDAYNAHEVARAKRRRFSRTLVLQRWARLRGFTVEVVSRVIAPLRIDRGPNEVPCPIIVALGYNPDNGVWFVTFAREPLVGGPKHIVGVTLATRAEAVRFAGALLAVLS
jgi:hypothetical protein